MGFLTTITFRNDAWSTIERNKEKIGQIVLDAMNNMKSTKEFSIGGYCNAVIAQPTRHADCHTCYINMGNTVIEMNSGREAEKLLNENPEFFNQLLEYMEDNIKQLKKIKKEKILNDINKTYINKRIRITNKKLGTYDKKGIVLNYKKEIKKFEVDFENGFVGWYKPSELEIL